MGATPGLLTEQGVFGSAPDTTADWYFGNNTQASLPTYNIPTGAQPYVQTAKAGGRIGRMGGGMMIIDDNDVVNNGMGAILNKYKQIRSEL